MKGEGRCSKAPDDGCEGSSHCVHLRPRKGDMICCWCGDLFIADETPKGPHGQYVRKRK